MFSNIDNASQLFRKDVLERWEGLFDHIEVGDDPEFHLPERFELCAIYFSLVDFLLTAEKLTLGINGIAKNLTWN